MNGPRPIFCPIEGLYRDVAVADATCAGRFSYHGETCVLGTDPDWVAAPVPDDEWRIAWHKSYESLHLAHAFAATGEERYLRTWEALVRSWLRRVPIGADERDSLARRLENWTYAWSAFAAAPGFSGLTDGLDEEFAAGMAAQAAFLRGHLTRGHRNHRTLELHSLFVVALGLPAVDPDGALLDFALAQLHQNLLTGTFPDGVHRECSTHYHLLALQSFLGARENARRFDLGFPDAFDEHLERACEFALHMHRPDGDIPALSDADGAGHRHLLELAAALFGRPDFLYGATFGSQGTVPEHRLVGFPAGGYFIQRSGWGDQGTAFERERFLIFDCGPLGDGGHGHYDALNVEIAAGGRALLVDPGRYTYDEDPDSERRWFKGTAAHNTVTVDGLDQTEFQPGRAKNQRGEGRFLGRLTAPGLDIVRGEAVSPNYGAVHRRRVAFIADEYWLIEDELEDQVPRDYALRWHLPADAEGATQVRGDVVRAPGVTLMIWGGGAPSLEAGWVSPEYGIKHPAPIVTTVAEGSPRAHFLTLVFPDETRTPSLRVRAQDDAGRVDVEVGGVGRDGSEHDLVAWRPGRGPLELGSRHVTAAAGWLRRSASGEETGFGSG